MGSRLAAMRSFWRDMVVSRVHNDLSTEEWIVSELGERLLLARKRT